jgi:Flp pilus assembly protein TadD
MRPALALVLLLLSSAAYAAPMQAPAPKPQAPAPKEVSSEDKLLAQLKQVERAEDAHPIEQKLMAMFRASGSPSVDLLVTRVQAALSATDKATAKKLIDAVTTVAPTYAEGWHIRAGMEHAAGDDTAALVSLQKVVQLNPRHFRAMDELADLLEEYGDKAGALKLYRRALALNPHLPGATQKVRELTTRVEGRDI